MNEIPSTFYYVVGGLIVTNASAIITLIAFIFKAGMFVSNTKAGIKESKDAAIRAHKRIDKIEEKI